MKPMDAPCVCHENVTFSARFRKISLVPPYADAIASFWKGRLASGPRASARPSLSHLLGNASVPFDISRTRAQAETLSRAICGDGRHILLVPGLMASEHRMEPLRAILNAAGYQAHGWDMGRNFGPRADTLEKIDARVDAIATRPTGDPTTIRNQDQMQGPPSPTLFRQRSSQMGCNDF